MAASDHSADIEKDAAGQDYAHLTNESVHSFSWNNITVTVKDRATKQPLDILSGVNGYVEAGELLALMGPRYTPLILMPLVGIADVESVVPARRHSSTFSHIVLLYQSRPCNRTYTSMAHQQSSLRFGN
jgi:hypothetical protein